MPSAKIIELRQILESRFPQEAISPAAYLPTGLSQLDQLLGGGLLRGAITQLVSPVPSVGTTLLLQEMIVSLQAASHVVGLIDGKDEFYPFEQMPFLLWVRCKNLNQALNATDLVLRDGNLPLTVLDLKHNPSAQKIPSQIWYRFHRLTEESRTTLLVIASSALVSSACATIQMTRSLEFADLSSCSKQIFRNLPLCYKLRRSNMQNVYVCA
jgi:hypothetical protein